MSALKLLIDARVDALLKAAPPDTCPFVRPNDKRQRRRLGRLRKVPERLKALLNVVTLARGELNRLSGAEAWCLYRLSLTELSAKVEHAAGRLDEELRRGRRKKLPENALIEYEATWRFSFTTLARERARHKRRKSANPSKSTSETEGFGPVKNWVDEPPGHLQFASATLAQVLARTRGKMPPYE